MAAVVNQDICIGCGACVGVCPVGAIALNDEGKAAVDPAVSYTHLTLPTILLV